MFACAAPVGAITTLMLLGDGGGGSEWGGPAVAMLFSAGTFLYVATVHVLPELTSHSGKLNRLDLCLLVIGTIAPLMLGLVSHEHGHGHGHGGGGGHHEAGHCH